MGLFSRKPKEENVTKLSSPPVITRTWFGGLEGTQRGTLSAKDADKVPAVVATRNRLIATASSMPLVEYSRDFLEVSNPFLAQPDSQRTRRWVIAKTVSDLYYYGFAYWRVVSRNSRGFPTSAKYVPFLTLQVNTDGYAIRTPDGLVAVAATELIQFATGVEGVLLSGDGQAIKDALELGDLARQLNRSTIPQGYFHVENPDSFIPSQETIDEFLATWHAKRGQGSYGYVPPGLGLKSAGASPEQLNMPERHRHSTTTVAQSVGGDMEHLGLPMTTRTYKNDGQVRQDYLDFSASLFTGAIEDTLSLPSITPRGNFVRFDSREFLKNDPATRQQIYTAAIANGTMTVAEARKAEKLPALPRGAE